MAQVSTCASRILPNRAWSSGASGVVRTLGTVSPAMRVATVPMTPVRRPRASSIPSMR